MKAKSSTDVRLLLAPDYVTDLIDRLKQSKNRIVLFTHIIAYDSSTRELVNELCLAAQRGVRVEVAGDVYTFGILRGWSRNPEVKRLRTMVKKLRRSGVRYRWIGQFGPFLFAGRTHVKWCVVDDYVYSFGGVNLYQKGIENADYMIGVDDARLAEELTAEHAKIERADKVGEFYRSRAMPSLAGEVLMDGGLAFDSIIYRRACQLSSKAKKIIFVSQYCPTGKLGRILKTKQAKLYFNDWRLATAANRFLIRTSMFRTGYKTLYSRDVYNHAKFIIFTMRDGSKVALTGSHNFVYGGVVLGTREINLETHDKKIISQLEKFFKDHIA